MKSDNQNPLAYFEYLLKYNRYTELKEEFLNSYRDFTSLEYINFQKGEVKLWEFFYDESKNIQQEKFITRNFQKSFELTLYNEYYTTINLIDLKVEFILTQGNSPKEYIHHLLIKLENLNHLSKLYTETTEVTSSITRIIEHINIKHISLCKTPLLSTIQKAEYNILDDNKIIETVLGYFKGQNEYREQIMTIESYTKMIGYISYFIENNILPENLEKIPPLGISKQLLRFSFWVLHKHLYSNKRTNLEFLSLVKSMFSDFDDWEFETLKKKFGNKDKVTVNGLMFVPEIIKKEIKRSY